MSKLRILELGKFLFYIALVQKVFLLPIVKAEPNSYKDTQEALCSISAAIEPSFKKADIQKNLCKDTFECSATLLAYWDGYEKYTKTAKEACLLSTKNFKLTKIKDLGLGNAKELLGGAKSSISDLQKVREEIEKNAKEKLEQNVKNIHLYSQDNSSNQAIAKRFELQINALLRGDLKPEEARLKTKQMIQSKDMSDISGGNRIKLQRNALAATYAAEFINDLQYDLKKNKKAEDEMNKFNDELSGNNDNYYDDAIYTPPTPIMGDSGLGPVLSGAASYALQKLGIGGSDKSDISGLQNSSTNAANAPQHAKGNALNSQGLNKNDIGFKIEPKKTETLEKDNALLKESEISKNYRAPTLDAIDGMASVLKKMEDQESRHGAHVEVASTANFNHSTKNEKEIINKKIEPFDSQNLGFTNSEDPFSDHFTGVIESNKHSDNRTPAQDNENDSQEPETAGYDNLSIAPEVTTMNANLIYESYAKDQLENPQFLHLPNTIANNQSLEQALKEISLFRRIHDCYVRAALKKL